ELEILSPKPGFAEQHPNTWWEHIRNATAEIKQKRGLNLDDVKAIGISYQMH
ncbi:TPA: carbohydrate kinase, partial [Candidatus Sumerlaeota bacterium]|nr:carbohydrate kinase [Candidatus Sumerlaeota bacterium]